MSGRTSAIFLWLIAAVIAVNTYVLWKVTFQELTKKGLSNISQTVIAMAQSEQLDAHANAVKIRL